MSDLPPLTPITLEEPNGTKWAFNPQSDMTPIESALIAQLFVKMIMGVWHGQPDWMTYVQLHKLDRHFRLVSTPVTSVEAIRRMNTTPEPVMRATEYIAIREIKADDSTPEGFIWRRGQRLVLMGDMPVPDGFVEATPENVMRIMGEMNGPA